MPKPNHTRREVKHSNDPLVVAHFACGMRRCCNPLVISGLYSLELLQTLLDVHPIGLRYLVDDAVPPLELVIR